MNLSNHQLINLPVFTQSSVPLGKIAGFEMEAETGKVITFFVKTGLIKDLLSQQLVVDFSQVISIDKNKMVVKDNVKKIPVMDLKSAELSAE